MHALAFLSTLLLPALSLAQTSLSGPIWATPHDSYSSSIGVLGCKVNTNRIAYWPAPPSCQNFCIQVRHPESGRSLKLLRIDQSQGAFDISYDAWNYLTTGYSAVDKPSAGGAIPMEFETLDPWHCRELFYTKNGAFPLSASNSMNFLASCFADRDAGRSNYVADNYVLYNILDSVCSWGFDEPCTLDWPAANQASCPNGLGMPVVLAGKDVWNVMYPSGEVRSASTNVQGDAQNLSGAGRVRGGVSLGGVLMAGFMVIVGAGWLL